MKKGFKRNVILSFLLLAAIIFSLVRSTIAATPNPGHNFADIGGGAAQGDILYGSAADTLSALPKSATAGQFLSNSGTNNNPAWAYVGGVLINRQTIISGTTYTPTAGTKSAVIEMWGAGGAGGSCTAVAGCACGGGGSGGYVEDYFIGVGAGPYTIAIGVGGTAVAGAAGNPGGNTTFNNGAQTITAYGGGGGQFKAGTAATKYTAGGAGGAISTNGDVNAAGAPGGWGSTSGTATIGATGAGGSTSLGGGGVGVQYASAAAVPGTAAIANTGSGGSGGGTGTGTVAAGGAGAAGRIVVWEFR